MKEFRIYITKLFIIACAVFMITSCDEKKQFGGYLYPIRENGLYGYIDSVGNRIIEPEFLWVSTFHNGLAMAVVDTIYCVVPDSMAYEVGERDTIINVYRMYTKYGYINKSGDFLIEPKFISYVNMPEIGFLAKDMDDCSNALYRHSFRNRRAMFYDTLTWKNGYIDTKGVVAIKPKYYYSEPFTNGRAVVKELVAEPVFYNNLCLNSSKLRCSYIDTLGNSITNNKYESLTRFNGRRGIGSYTEIFIDSSGNKQGYTIHNEIIDGYGNLIKDLGLLNRFYDYSKDGISVAKQVLHFQVYDGMFDSYSFVDEEGNYLQPLKGLTENQIDSLNKCDEILEALPEDAPIADATYFNDGFAGITPDCKRWFVIDKYLIIHGYGKESIFDGFKAFNNGLAAVKKNGKWGFINRKIKEQIPCKYDSCGAVYPYLEEIFEYNIQGEVKKKAYINRKDSLVWESPLYKSEKIENRYSIKKSKDYGKWTYKYNSFIQQIPFWTYGMLGALFFIIIVFSAIFVGRLQHKGTRSVITSPTLIQTEEVISTSQINNEKIEDTRIYPSVGQYAETIKESVKAPDDYFDKLKHLRPVLDGNGEPIMSSGNFAVVFKMKDEYGKQYAVRCFHRAQQGRERNYKLICEELAKVSSPYLSPIRYYDKELFVESGEYPVLLMDWVEGMTLDKYIKKVIDNKKALSQLATNFKNLAIWLLSQPFAHGDLKPDNILVKNDGSLVLVDYDGMFVPAMQGQNAREIGSPDFRNPSRTEMDFDKNIDSFPIISILLSLELIAAKSEYLERFGKEDRLLFSHDDYLNLRESGIFKRALTSYADDIPELAAMLERMVNGEICNRDTIKKLLLTNNLYVRLKPNEEIERKASWLVGVTFFFTLFIPLYLRSIFYWHIIMLFIITILIFALLFLVLVFVDRSRPNKNYHIKAVDNDGPGGCLCWLNIIPLLLMMDSFTKWFNGVAPFLSQPYYEGNLYMTVIIWVIWWCSNMIIISLPIMLLKWRLKHFKSPEEKRAEQIELELSAIRVEVEKEDKQWEKHNKRNTNVYHNDWPF